ncbi:MAG: prepilin-type N-terminal cleavage/methylation domain-containing protein [Desulfobacterales bacterium]|nr:prepilin-type N-terminal cleavage/methylation domain-containing protein [Desulfobacterales bacterium]
MKFINTRTIPANAFRAGFSLIELMIGIAVIAIVGSIAVPSMMGMNTKNGAQRAADEMYGVIMEAKMRAVRNNITVNIFFDIANNSYRCPETGETVTLNKYRGNVTFTNAPNGAAPIPRLTFSPQGFATLSGNVFIVEPNHNTFYRLQTSYAGVTTVDRWSEGAARWN